MVFTIVLVLFLVYAWFVFMLLARLLKGIRKQKIFVEWTIGHGITLRLLLDVFLIISRRPF